MVDSTLSRATATSCASLPVTLATITTFPPNPDLSPCAHNRWRCWACSGAGGRRLARSADDDRSGHIKHRYPSYPLTTLTVRPLLHPFPSLPLLRPCFVSREAAMHAADHCSSITLYLSLISSFCSIFGVDVCLVCSSQQPREGEGKGGRGCK